jgi:serine protease Do
MAEVQQGFGALVAAIRPAVVSIAARRPVAPMAPGTGMQFLDPFPGPRTVVGSGVIVHPDGLILTSRQVAGEAELLQASFFRADRRPLSARRIAADTATDLALYRVAAPGRLPFARLGDSSGVRSGDIVVAIGSPFGLTETVTHGIVSATRRAVTVEGRVLTDVIQTDAAINQGNAGGPLVDIQAAVIGINVAIFSTDATFSGIGFAIPSNLAALFIQRAIGVRG